MRKSSAQSEAKRGIESTDSRARFPNLMPDFTRYPIDDQKKISELLTKLGPENFMVNGWVNDPELSKFLTIYNSQATVLAERLDMGYAIYIRTSELLEGTFNSSEREFLENLRLESLHHVCRILNVDSNNISIINTLMEDRSKHRLADYQYIPGKATEYWQPFRLQKTTQTSARQGLDNILKAFGLSKVLHDFKRAKDLDLESRIIYLSRTFNYLNKLIRETEKKIASSSEEDRDLLRNKLFILRLMVENNVDIFTNICNFKNRNEGYHYLSAIENDKELIKKLNITNADYWKELPIERIHYLLQKVQEYSITSAPLRSVNLDSLWKDIQLNATYVYDPRHRDGYRVIVYHNRLIRDSQDGEKSIIPFTTGEMMGHKGIGQCAFTLNLRGELSVFNHLGMKPDKDNVILAHSSMNAGDVVIAAGELTVNKEGQVISISDYSGHYQPTPYNIFLMIRHLQQQGMKIENIDIKLMTQVDGVNGMKEGDSYHYNAKDILNHFEGLGKRFSIGMYCNSQQVQTDSTMKELLEYIKNTDRNTQSPIYKVLYWKDAIFQKVTSTQNFIGSTQAKNQIAKNVLYNRIEFNKGAMSKDAFLQNLAQQKKLLQALGSSERSTLVKIIDTITKNLLNQQPKAAP